MLLNKNSLKIFFFFFSASILGVLLHELGHILVAIINGSTEVHLGYSYMWANNNHFYYPPLSTLGEVYNNVQQSQLVGQKLGGPLQTNLTGLLGFFLLYKLSKRTTIDAWNTKHLLYIVLCFFLSRNVYNPIVHLLGISIFKTHAVGDETSLFLHYGINDTLGHLTLLVISSAILAYVCFALVQKHRWQLILWGGLGSVAGTVFWMGWAGPIILP